jgi:hypothetical protein
VGHDHRNGGSAWPEYAVTKYQIMATIKNTRKQGFGMQRNASEPYTIHLDGKPYILSAEALKAQVDEKLQRKREWFYPTLKFISIENGTVRLRLIHKEVSQEMTVCIEPDKLHFSCSCGMMVETLHTYRTLEALAGYRGTDYFAQFRPNGLIELSTAHKKYFDKKVTDKGIDIRPRANLGSVYQLSHRLEQLNLMDILHLPQVTSPQANREKDTVLTYILMDSCQEKYLPFLLPCVGVLNKGGTDVKGFHQFISGTEKEYDPFLTDEQRALNQICYEMWQQVETQSGSLFEGEPEQERSPSGIFSLWEKALPLLRQQEFTYKYILYGRRELKQKPSRTRIERIGVEKDRPRLYFQLINKGAIWELRLKAALRAKPINNYDIQTNLFIVDGGKFYLLPSLQDAGIAEWMRKSNGHITVFKEHFPEFEKEYLNPLRESYWVHIV